MNTYDPQNFIDSLWFSISTKTIDIVYVTKAPDGRYFVTEGGGKKALYRADLAVEKLEDGNYYVVKDRHGTRVGTKMTEEELFIERI